MIAVSTTEKVRDSIGAILAADLSIQQNESDQLPNNDPNKLPFTLPSVWVERFIPLDKTEVPAVVVAYSQSTMSGQERSSTRQIAVATFFVDAFVSKKGINGRDAMVALNRLLHLMRSILMNPKYANLNVEGVHSRNVNNIAIADPNRENTNNLVMGRIGVEVKLTEKEQLIDAPTVGSAITNVTLGLTDKGYVYEYQKN